ncbi:lantibiotic dehydratase [Nocardiopsis kunsanensis]|uniref:Lanthionine biosynthesis protein n=1 Tax=Nocardiopsis kunsanensis TaxID=141693 RepID=A0A918XIL6_9ACTN|nr:lantibiotic dehydratase [Nocardiopsis kunsanensis]GHD32346.1 lanthionine biosynthesis protein [Nocardiopsis kunsanensis]
MTENPAQERSWSRAEGRWTSTDVFMLRAGGLPWSAVEPLASEAMADWAASVLELEDRLSTQAQEISDLIGPLVTEHEHATRQKLLSLRRDVFNLRAPKGRTRTAEALAALPDGISATVSEWISLREELSEKKAEGQDLLAGETERQRDHLRTLARDPRLRDGLLLASPSLERHLPTYLDAGHGRLSKRARKIERSLVEYVLRTACKTSPFSTLTTVAVGSFAQGVGDAFSSDPRGVDGHSHVRINVAALGRVADAVTEDWERLTDLPVILSSGHSLDHERVRYVRRTKLGGENSEPGAFDSLREELFFLSHSGLLDEVMEVLDKEPGIRLGELLERLYGSAGREPEQVRAYVEALIRLSLVRLPSLDVDIHSGDPLRTFRDGLADLRRPWADAVVTELDHSAGLVEAYAGADTDGRRELRDGVRDSFARVSESLGTDPAAMPQGLLYEDVSLPGLDLRADKEIWDGSLLADLQRLSDILPLFDMLLPHRLVLLGFFRARYGEDGVCDDILTFVHEFHRDIYDQYLQSSSRRQDFDEDGEYVPLDNWLRMPEVDALNDARKELIGRMRRAYADLPDPDTELVLDDDFMDGVAERLPAPVHQLDSRSFFLQASEQDGRLTGVVNRSYSGLTLLYSRFLHCFEQTRDPALADELRHTLQRVCPEGTVFAELTGGYDTTNLNLHPPVTEYEIVCPGESSSRPPEECVRVEELQIRYRAEQGLHLYCPRIDRVVIPVYLGFLLPLALPEVQRALLLFSPTSMAPLDLWQGTDRPLGDAPIGGHPRVRYGDLVLTRHTWKTAPDRLPRRQPDQSDAEWFLSWQRWRSEHRLPRRVFAAVDTGGAPEGGEADEGPTHPSKPQYVDFDSFFSLQLLDHMVAKAKRRVVMTEMLPGPDDLWLQGDEGAHVAEQTVEITRTPVTGADDENGRYRR